MRKEISFRNKEAISAYLDGELSSKELLHLEQKFKEIPDLANELEELSRVREALRNLPRIRAPRNFTLTPETADIRRVTYQNNQALPVLSSISLIASFLFLFVLITDLVFPKREVAVQISPLALEAAPMELESPESMEIESEADLALSESLPSIAEENVTGGMVATDENLKMESREAIPSEPFAKNIEETVSVEGGADFQHEEIPVRKDLQPVQMSQFNYRLLEVLLASLAVLTGIGAYLIKKANKIRNQGDKKF